MASCWMRSAILSPPGYDPPRPPSAPTSTAVRGPPPPRPPTRPCGGASVQPGGRLEQLGAGDVRARDEPVLLHVVEHREPDGRHHRMVAVREPVGKSARLVHQLR